jgi:hypothetical protein
MGLVGLHVTAYLGFSSPSSKLFCRLGPGANPGMAHPCLLSALWNDRGSGGRDGPGEAGGASRQQRLFIARTLKALSVRGTCSISSTCFETQITRKCCRYNSTAELFFCCPLICPSPSSSLSHRSHNPSVFLSRTQLHLISPGFFGPSIQLPIQLILRRPYVQTRASGTNTCLPGCLLLASTARSHLCRPA